MNIVIANDVIMFMTRFNFSKLVCLVVKSAGTVPIPPKISIWRNTNMAEEYDLQLQSAQKERLTVQQ